MEQRLAALPERILHNTTFDLLPPETKNADQDDDQTAENTDFVNLAG